VIAPREFRPAVFLQGACETTHGLSDTLLSITAVRSNEIATNLATLNANNSH
jgi:L-ornithine N5-oxygenase